ncbi:hypothetical protein DFJ58DRAFT_912409 [Suillus subalutaceus]|uniref:uncharacterized protein n=1 Tax=Suillus subalutaceus TaxID=48586 RepID=UPI001B87149C|nr:uncharacterized protein DFJ58DRAFT_912409 [Suillus subalutaceus]KAG1863220.1 hypothetical protein DFJ58DRAFT_912409 [Suillus subalutaceus]
MYLRLVAISVVSCLSEYSWTPELSAKLLSALTDDPDIKQGHLKRIREQTSLITAIFLETELSSIINVRTGYCLVQYLAGSFQRSPRSHTNASTRGHVVAGRSGRIDQVGSARGAGAVAEVLARSRTFSGDGETLFKTAEFRRNERYPDAAVVKDKKVPTQPKKPLSKPRVLPTTAIKAATSIQQPKFRKGHMPYQSVSSDEEEKAHSQLCTYTTDPARKFGINANYYYIISAQGSG